MKSATVRELKNNASELLRHAAREDVIITSRGRPVALLSGLHSEDVAIRPRARGHYSNDKFRDRAFQVLARIWKVKPDNGKQWVSQQEHDRVLYGESSE